MGNSVATAGGPIRATGQVYAPKPGANRFTDGEDATAPTPFPTAQLGDAPCIQWDRNEKRHFDITIPPSKTP